MMLKIQLCITGINAILKWKTVILNNNIITILLFCIFIQINAINYLQQLMNTILINVIACQAFCLCPLNICLDSFSLIPKTMDETELREQILQLIGCSLLTLSSSQSRLIC